MKNRLAPRLRQVGLLVVSCMVVGLTPQVAAAHNAAVSDGNDTQSPFDFKSVAIGHDRENIYVLMEFRESWSTGQLYSNNKYIGLDLDTRGDNRRDFYVALFPRSGGGAIGRIYSYGNDDYKGNAPAFRADSGRLVGFQIPREKVLAGRQVRWQAYSRYRSSTFCQNDCWDVAPRYRKSHHL